MPVNHESDGLCDLQTHIARTKTTFLESQDDGTLYVFMKILSMVEVVVPVRAITEGKRTEPVPLNLFGADEIYTCFTHEAFATGISLPIGVSCERIPFREFIIHVDAQRKGFIIDPGHMPVEACLASEECHYFRERLYPPIQVVDIGEILVLKSECLRINHRYLFKALLIGLCHCMVYIPGTTVYSEADKQRIRELHLQTGEEYTAQQETDFQMDRIYLHGVEYVPVYLRRSHLPKQRRNRKEQVGKTTDAEHYIHREVRRFSIIELAKLFGDNDEMGGLVVDYKCRAGTVYLPPDILRTLPNVPHENVVYEDMTDR